MSTADIISQIIKLPGLTEAYRQIIVGDLNGFVARILIRYPWKFNMAEGSHTTTTANEYTLKGGTNNDKSDLAILESIRFDSDYEYLTYKSPARFDLEKIGSEYGLGDVLCYTIRKTDEKRFPIIEFGGTMISGKTFYYYYRQRPETEPLDKFPLEFESVWRNYLLSRWDNDPIRMARHQREYQEALNDLKRVWIDMSARPPQYQELTRDQMRLATWGNRRYLR